MNALYIYSSAVEQSASVSTIGAGELWAATGLQTIFSRCQTAFAPAKPHFNHLYCIRLHLRALNVKVKIPFDGIDIDATQRSVRDMITTARSWRQ